jgi:hypothetical protein
MPKSWRTRVAYRDKPEIYGDPNTPESQQAQLYLLWLLPSFVVAPNLGRIAKFLGFRGAYEVLLFIAIATSILCIVGAIFAYRNARAQASRDLDELTGSTERQK